jgi:simple sugar transport system permease protein
MRASRAFWGRHETILALIIIALVIVVALINPRFLSWMNTFFVLKNSAVIALFAIGFLLVLLVGGIDVSFAAVGVVSMYLALKCAIWIDMEMAFLPILLMAAGIGTAMGMINGFLVIRLKVPSLIVTLGTMSLFRGFLLFFVGTQYLRQLPKGVNDFASSNLFTITAANGAKVGLHSSLLIVAAIALAVAALLRFTVLGRQIYAIGSDPIAAVRAGFPVARIEFIVFTLAGCLAGVAGLLSASFIRVANPFSIIGTELDVIAAVIIGGASIAGGRGTVAGALLGVLLIAIVRNSLTLLAVPAYWHGVVIGALIIAAIAIPALKGRRRLSKQTEAVMT